MNLPEDVINSEFPNLKLNSKDGKTVTLAFDNGENVVISKQNSDGTTDSEVYNFKAVTDETVFPPVPDLPNYWHNVDLDKWNGVIDSNFKDSLKSNNDQIQKSINSLYEYETDQRNFFVKLKDTLSDFKGFVETIISSKVADYLSKFSDQFYKKEEIDSMMADLSTRIDNVRKRVPNDTIIGTFHNPSRSDQMPTNIDVNDKVTPEAQSVLDEIEEGGN
ncbi:hypothetical protein D1B17_08590 [Companilactobacillus zhachilii]|uniref:Uncharacterized protein n=1 Tax=Companilactobacillus zhachilii TaxID=2304606 RepID=A0A386PRN2_9LACO|nr:hypothetical protein [Companilactobacillus zhachilii]AYE38681.1 hypothetical protein D1B17_08590 [Companilactobacillus zhachilii]